MKINIRIFNKGDLYELPFELVFELEDGDEILIAKFRTGKEAEKFRDEKVIDLIRSKFS